jgi:aspartyl/asparaginyl-tRNA synthetase
MIFWKLAASKCELASQLHVRKKTQRHVLKVEVDRLSNFREYFSNLNYILVTLL